MALLSLLLTVHYTSCKNYATVLNCVNTFESFVKTGYFWNNKILLYEAFINDKLLR